MPNSETNQIDRVALAEALERAKDLQTQLWDVCGEIESIAGFDIDELSTSDLEGWDVDTILAMADSEE